MTSKQAISDFVDSLDLRELHDLKILMNHRVEKLTPQFLEHQELDITPYGTMHKFEAWVDFWRKDAHNHGFRTIFDLWNGYIQLYNDYSTHQYKHILTPYCVVPSQTAYGMLLELSSDIYLFDDTRFTMIHSDYKPLNLHLSNHIRENNQELWTKFEKTYVAPIQSA